MTAARSITILLMLILMPSIPSATALAQEQDEVRFIRHLMNQSFWDDALFAIIDFESRHAGRIAGNAGLRDTLNFWAGWSAYNREMLPFSISRLEQVTEQHPSHKQAAFYTFYLRTYLASTAGRRDELKTVAGELGAAGFGQDIHSELQSLQLAGMQLLLRDFHGFYRHAESFSGTYFAMASQQEQLLLYARELERADRKSPFAAAVMSAVIPGSGKYYAGRRGSAVSSFLQVSVFGAIFAESLHHAGTRHARTWVSGSVFSLFYLANIRGSAVAVRISKEEIYEEMDQRILFDLHIPLRAVFR